MDCLPARFSEIVLCYCPRQNETVSNLTQKCGAIIAALASTMNIKPTPSPHGSIAPRSEEHTSELQSLMRTSYAVFCLKKKNTLSGNSGGDRDTDLAGASHDCHDAVATVSLPSGGNAHSPNPNTNNY